VTVDSDRHRDHATVGVASMRGNTLQYNF
jgi:hypothetical protein